MARLLEVLIMIFAVTALVTNVTVSSSSSEELAEDEDDKEKADFERLLEVARNLSNYYIPPNSTVCVLGQSWTWIGKILEIQEDYIPTGNNFIYVPFSGEFLKSDSANYYTSKNAVLPTSKEIANYRALLQRLKADPESIIDRYQNYGRKTVIADQILSGRGLASYLYVLYSWAKEKEIVEKLAEALQVVITVNYDEENKVSHFYVDEYSISCTVMEVDPMLMIKIVVPEQFRGFRRLIISYKHKDWIKEVSEVTLERQPDNVNKINKLREYIKYDLEIREPVTTTTKSIILYLGNISDTSIKLTLDGPTQSNIELSGHILLAWFDMV